MTVLAAGFLAGLANSSPTRWSKSPGPFLVAANSQVPQLLEGSVTQTTGIVAPADRIREMIRSLLAAESAPPSKTASKSPSLKWLIASFTVPVGVTKNPEDCQMLLLDSNSHGSKPIASTTVIGIGTSDTGPFTSSLGDRSINGRFDTCLSSSRRKSPAGVRTACNVGLSVKCPPAIPLRPAGEPERMAGMKAFKQFVRGATKVVGGIAGLVFLRAPFTNYGLALMVGSVAVGLACVGAYTWAEPDDDAADSAG